MRNQSWDMALRKVGNRTRGYMILGVNLPAPLSRALNTQGLTRVKIEIRDEGILLVPYRGHVDDRGIDGEVELPGSWGE